MAKRPRRVPCELAGPWPKGTTIRDVTEYAASALSEQLMNYGARHEEKNLGGMAASVILLRAVVTRLDAFRRIKAREWRAAPAASSPEGENTK